MCHGVCRKPPGTFVPFNTGSLAREDEQGRGAGQNPAMWVVGGEKGEVRELEGTTAHL